ncbi:Fe-S cluster assembly protein HesB [Aquihabitans sp. G128]|uniref:HhH-GPD-type base excision DNA repair protein n=1 Tax=Aquihabitans sp. G128 TaxID=2849779 RepID=UPI001C241D6C|nr:HhH-GPD-type base excision DNA repair protein [Aquihabitans sp. G128]QXC61259.1 Fe-S cluster assembly protein HesB [Aquihabitans sp. G128]QXC61306.1 Fe-S cluster assembly protein HesB [Aquihabitans sp. G128]
MTAPDSFPITFDDDANELLAHDPLALLYGMLLDQQVPMTWAFRSPMVIKERLGDRWSPAGIAAMDPEEVVAVFCEKPAVHRYPAAMARRAHGIARVIVDEYEGDTASIWTTAKSGTTLYARVSALPGFAEEKSRIFVALLAKRFDVKPRGWKAAAGAFSDTQPRSAADVDSLPKLREVQAWKKLQKAAKKSKSEFSL